MYTKILVALDTTPADEAVLPHVMKLASGCSAEVVLLHVADGWAARHFASKVLQPVESEEIRSDRAYLAAAAERLAAAGLQVTTRLALGNPPDQIVAVADAERCDLIAMTTHGHRLIGDILHGSTIDAVRHRTRVPLLVVRAERR